jgi:integrase
LPSLRDALGLVADSRPDLEPEEEPQEPEDEPEEATAPSGMRIGFVEGTGTAFIVPSASLPGYSYVTVLWFLGAKEGRDVPTVAEGSLTISFHGLRHTAATLALKAGEGVYVVSRRLGHKKIEITLNTYAHVLPSMGKEVAARMSSVLRLSSLLG